MKNLHDTAGDITRSIEDLKRSIYEQKRLIRRASLDRDFVKQEVVRMREEFDKKEKDLQQKEVAIRRLEGDQVRSSRELNELERVLSERNRTGGNNFRSTL